MATNAAIGFLDQAREAWEAGFSIVAASLNARLAEHATGLKLKAKRSAHGRTLFQCRQAFFNALAGVRPYLPDLPDVLVPWILCHDDIYPRISEAHLHDDRYLELRLERNCRFLQKSADWKPEDWKSHVVDPVEKHAAGWRAKFKSWSETLRDDLGAKEPGKPSARPLTDTEQQVDEAVRRLGRATLKQLVQATGIGEKTLTTHTIKGLKCKRGLLTRPYRYE